MTRGLRIGVAIVLLLSIGVLGEVLFFQGTAAYKKHFSTPCTEALPYTLGTVDAQFDIDNESVHAALTKAARVWNVAAGKEVLVYAPEDPDAIRVNLVYDKRQQTVETGADLDEQKATLDVDRNSIQQTQARYDALEQAYAAAKASFEQRYQAYQQQVEQANASGGASKEEYKRLNALSLSLKAEQEALNQKVDELNSLANTLKSKVGMFNQGVEAMNSVVRTFNTAANQDFDAGKYVRSAAGTRITIYAFDSEAALTLELTHEFGHALEIGHNENPESIMYAYAKAQKLVLSAEDTAALEEACKLK